MTASNESKEVENNVAPTVTSKVGKKQSIRKNAKKIEEPGTSVALAATHNTSTRSSRNNKTVSLTVKIMSSGFSLLDKHKQVLS